MCSGASQASADPVEYVASHEGWGLDVLNAEHLCQLEVLQRGCPPDVMSGKHSPCHSANWMRPAITVVTASASQGFSMHEGCNEAGSNMSLFADRQDMLVACNCCPAAGER